MHFSTKQAFRYNAFAFAARCTSCLGGLALDGTIQGTAGDLVLNGNGDGTYDECPAYNIVNFSPNGATVGPVTTIDNDVALISCNQDLRQDFTLNLTKVLFTVWNEYENSFTGSYQCVDSVNFVPLSASDNPGSSESFELRLYDAEDRERPVPGSGDSEHAVPRLQTRRIARRGDRVSGDQWRHRGRSGTGKHHPGSWRGGGFRAVGCARPCAPEP